MADIYNFTVPQYLITSRSCLFVFQHCTRLVCNLNPIPIFWFCKCMAKVILCYFWKHFWLTNPLAANLILQENRNKATCNIKVFIWFRVWNVYNLVLEHWLIRTSGIQLNENQTHFHEICMQAGISYWGKGVTGHQQNLLSAWKEHNFHICC